jgi:hypothetical protein
MSNESFSAHDDTAAIECRFNRHLTIVEAQKIIFNRQVFARLPAPFSPFGKNILGVNGFRRMNEWDFS